MNGTNTLRWKGITLEEDDRVVLTEHIQNGIINLRPLDMGNIVALRNQVEAKIWFAEVGRYHTDYVAQALQVNFSHGHVGKFCGVVLEVPAKRFAIKYNRSKDHGDITIEEDVAKNIPYFVDTDIEKFPSNTRRNVGNGVFETVHYYMLRDIIDVVSDQFEEWVRKNLKSKKVTKREKDNGDYPSHWDTRLTEESHEIFHAKKEALELEFAKRTRIYYEFNGGLLLD